MEHDRAWQDAQVEQELRSNFWLHASVAKRLLMTGWFAICGAAPAVGVGLATGEGWWPWVALGASLGLLPWLFRWQKFVAWTVRQNYPTDELLRRQATAVQRDGIRTDGAVGKKSPPYWPQAPKD